MVAVNQEVRPLLRQRESEYCPVMKKDCRNIGELQLSSHVDQSMFISRAQSGDGQSFDALVEPHLQRIYLTAIRITRNHEDAEDACQESLIKALVHIQSFQGNAQFSAWLTRIVPPPGVGLVTVTLNDPAAAISAAVIAAVTCVALTRSFFGSQDENPCNILECAKWNRPRCTDCGGFYLARSLSVRALSGHTLPRETKNRLRWFVWIQYAGYTWRRSSLMVQIRVTASLRANAEPKTMSL